MYIHRFQIYGSLDFKIFVTKAKELWKLSSEGTGIWILGNEKFQLLENAV